MTKPSSQANRHWLGLVLAALTGVLITLFGAGTGSVAAADAAQTRVGPHTLAAQVVVGPHSGIGAGQRLGNDLPAYDFALATGVATKAACFVARTPILLADGTSKPIEQINLGDKVTAYDPASGKAQTREVKKTYIHHNVPTYNVTVDGETVTTTEEHPFFVQGRGWPA